MNLYVRTKYHIHLNELIAQPYRLMMQKENQYVMHLFAYQVDIMDLKSINLINLSFDISSLIVIVY